MLEPADFDLLQGVVDRQWHPPEDAEVVTPLLWMERRHARMK